MCEKPNEAIIRKIQLLFNLGKRGGTEAEAEAAMSKAQELLAKYNLDMAMIEAAAVEGGTVVVQEKREKTKIDRSASYKWQGHLCAVIAEANFCWHWVQEMQEEEPSTIGGKTYHRRIKRHVVLGRESNVVAVMMMYGFLADVIEEMVPWKGKERLCKSAISWREGCASRLEERIKAKAYEMAHQNEAQAVSQFGLVLRDVTKKEYELNYDALYGEGSWQRGVERQRKYELERASKPEEPKKELSEKEKAKQEKENEKWWKRYQNKQEREAQKRDISAFMAGRKIADTISLQDRIK